MIGLSNQADSFFSFSFCVESVILFFYAMAHNHFWFLKFKIVSPLSKNHFSPFVCIEISLYLSGELSLPELRAEARPDDIL